jgi:hypothetical protein
MIDKLTFKQMLLSVEKYWNQVLGLRALGFDSDIQPVNEMMNYLIEAIRLLTNDVDNIIGYFCWTLDFGKSWKHNDYIGKDGKNISLKSYDELWAALVENQ